MKNERAVFSTDNPWRQQLAGQCKLNEVRYDMNNFNRAFSKRWSQNFDLVLARDCARPVL